MRSPDSASTVRTSRAGPPCRKAALSLASAAGTGAPVVGSLCAGMVTQESRGMLTSWPPPVAVAEQVDQDHRVGPLALDELVALALHALAGAEVTAAVGPDDEDRPGVARGGFGPLVLLLREDLRDALDLVVVLPQQQVAAHRAHEDGRRGQHGEHREDAREPPATAGRRGVLAEPPAAVGHLRVGVRAVGHACPVRSRRRPPTGRGGQRSGAAPGRQGR